MSFQDRPARFAPLLVALLFALVISEPMRETLGTSIPSLIAYPAVLFGAVLALGRTGWVGRSVVGFWGVTALGSIIAQMLGGGVAPVASHALETVLAGVVTILLLAEIMRARRVSTDILLGGISGYLMLGVFYLGVFSLVEMMQPGSFLDRGARIPDLGGEDAPTGRFIGFTYFSFVTLTTLGYGDIVPVTGLARSVATTEAVLGQLYLTFFVAVLVGMHIADRRR